jgi:voltage-gated potassium channel
LVGRIAVVNRRSSEAYHRYRQWADPIVALLALILLVVVSVAASSATGDLPTIGRVIGVATWALLVADIVVRLAIVPSVKHYVLRHPLEVLSVVAPFLRVVLLGRLFGILGRGRSRLADRATGYVAYITVLAIVFGALLAVDAERGAPGATILDFGDGVWWAIVTVATVGYGDVVPVTPAGRTIGVALIMVSISLLSIITANISSRFVLARATAEAESEANAAQEVQDRLARIEAAVARIESRLAESD